MPPRPDAFEKPPVEDLLLVGRITRPHGVVGEVKIQPETDDPARLLSLPVVFVGATAGAAVAMKVERARLQPAKGQTLGVLKLGGVNDRDAADALRKQGLYARIDDLPPLADDELFLHDLVGLTVVTDAGEEVGTVVDVQELPAHDTLVVARPDGSEVLIPAVPAFVQAIDLDAEQVVITPIEGLL